MYHIGVDEAGRGPMIGPLVVAAMAIPKKDLKLLEENNITDSKKLSPKKRDIAFKQIEKFIEKRGWVKHITICNPINIDFAMESSNLNILETELFANSINNLEIDFSGKGKLILDACDVNQERFGERVTNLVNKWPWNSWELISIHGADHIHRSVGAASIIAKVTRDNIIKEIGKNVGINIGSGYPSDPTSKKALYELCKGDVPNDCLRWNWASIRNHWEKEKGTKVPKRDFNNIDRGITSQYRLSDY
ncbi:MAG: ribonuclease HII [Euryarchaeota archaeon]|nr:ribonuclease HII [Euryarchaeota archaeon]|tara:strand:+ start:250 stop:993 length:744 start_codon:yes stop_codon:yes gene_type:complete